MKKFIYLIFLIIACSKKTSTTQPPNPSNPYQASDFWGFKAKSKLKYSYHDSTIYNYSFYSSTIIMPNPDTLTRTFGDTNQLTIPYQDSIWSILNTTKVIYDTLKINNNYIASKIRGYDFFKELNINIEYDYPYPLNPSYVPISPISIPTKDSLYIVNFIFACSLRVYIDTVFIDSSKLSSSKIDSLNYIIVSSIYSRVKYHYKFDKIVSGNLNCNSQDTTTKQDYATKFILDTIKLLSYNEINYRAYLDTTFARIQHSSNNPNSNLIISKRIKWFFKP
jgi:hypothetical protein